jgi:thiol-disulfide isomerase/thioredoxin
MPTLTLYGALYCHLCEEMYAALEPLAKVLGFTVNLIEIDDYPELEQQYREKIPLLMLGQQEICHYYLDEQALRAVLKAL